MRINTDQYPYSEPARYTRVKILFPKLTNRGPRAFNLHVSPRIHDHAQLENRRKPLRGKDRLTVQNPRTMHVARGPIRPKSRSLQVLSQKISSTSRKYANARMTSFHVPTVDRSWKKNDTPVKCTCVKLTS